MHKIIPFLLATTLLVSVPSSFAQDGAPKRENRSHLAPDMTTSALCQDKLDAVQNDDYAGFLMNIEANLRGQLPKDAFEGAAKLYAPRLKGGYEGTFLGEVRKKESVISLWKLKFNDQGDDVLVQMTTHGGKVNVFLLS